jgi:poly(3-hydroxybutyrate) depolymerase
MMRKINLFNVFCILLLVATVSCASGQQKENQKFDTSKIYPAVTCSADTNLSYALFLPPQYEKEKPCPILILFDSHGDGLLPVNLFSSEAAKSGFILVGSNNSKNGMQIEQTTAIFRTIMADVSDRFSIVKKAVYVCGFSGGSRVAGAVAITEPGVAGVVGCGAGLPNIKQKPVNDFSYLTVVGNQDFNLTEMQQLDESFERAGYQHHIIVFNGIHQWPVKEVIPEIFEWIRFDAMRKLAIPTVRSELDNFIEANDKIATSMAASGNLPKQQEIYLKMMHYLQGLTDVAPLQAEIKRLSGEKDVIAFHKEQEKLLETEQELQHKYSPEIQQQDVDWWAKETKRLQTLSEKPENPEISQVYKRLLGYLSLNCYMYSTGALKQGDLASASKYIEIYRLVDPSNSEHRYLAAEVAAMNHNPEAAFSLLKHAFDLGFNDIQRLKSDVNFKPYQQDERFINLIKVK